MAFSKWMNYLSKIQRIEHFTVKMINKWKNRKVNVSYNTWKSNVNDIKQQRHTIHLAYTRLAIKDTTLIISKI